MVGNQIQYTDMNLNERLPKQGEINILLNSYNDIFSHFDPSPYTERILSDDFIMTVKNVSKNKTGINVILRLNLPVDARDEQKEKKIATRLHNYFGNVYQQLRSEIRKKNNKGLLITFIGVIIMTIASYISFIKPEKYSVHLLLVLFEPAGWFLVWVGLDYLVYASKETKKELVFYTKMKTAEIIFFTHLNKNIQ